MSRVYHLVEDYFRRTRQPGDGALDGVYQFEVTMLRDVLTRLEVILCDENVPPETVDRVLRCMLYGAPSPAAAELRMRQTEEMIRLHEQLPPSAVIPGGL